METATINHQLLAKAGSSLSFVSGETIFRETELNGNVIETVAPGGFFGEMALIDGSPRVAIIRSSKASSTNKVCIAL